MISPTLRSRCASFSALPAVGLSPGLVLGLVLGLGLAPPAAQAASQPWTLEQVLSAGSLSDDQPEAAAATTRASYAFAAGHLLRAELLHERKFDQTGGLTGLSYTHALTPDWLLSAGYSVGRGGLNWARQREDLELAAKWGPGGRVITRFGLYHAHFDAQRMDRGQRASVAVYLPADWVLEAGLTHNISQPGRVHSTMPFVAATVGRDGYQYLSLRLASGREAWQPLGEGLALQDFRSDTLTLNWRRWMSPSWGLIGHGEVYRNPRYRRYTLGGGAFVQF